MLQVGQAGITGAKIVDGDGVAECLQLGNDLCILVDVLHRRGFGDFKHQPLRRNPGLPHHAGNAVDQIGAHLQWRQIQRHLDRRHTERIPAQNLCAHFAQHPVTNRNDQTAALGNRNEFRRTHVTEFRMMPAQQRLDAGQYFLIAFKFGLKVQRQLLRLDCLLQGMTNAQMTHGAGMHGRFEKAVGIAAALLGFIHCGIGVLHQAVHGLAAVRKYRNADAGSDAQGGVIELEVLPQDTQNILGQIFHHVGRRQVAHDHHEFIAANPRNHVFTANAIANALADGDQQTVAHRMPE